MIVCLCNALSDRQLTEAVTKGARRPADVYAKCACKAQCGTCTRTILALLRELAGGGAAETEPA